MDISLNLYSTPLWFGFIQSWIYGLLFWNRSRQNARLSDFLLGLIIIGMGFSIWEYMLGFSGIEILWQELDFFPRNFGYAFPPLCYFYFKSQIDTQFRFTKKDLYHFIPFLIHTCYHVGIYSMGHEFVAAWQEHFHNRFHVYYLELTVEIALYFYYFYRSFSLYQHYHQWTKTQFSDVDTVSFTWYRNFLLVLFLSLIAFILKHLLDALFDLSFNQDWWDNLVRVVLIYYVCIAGYAQAQPSKALIFKEENTVALQPKEKYDEAELNKWRITLSDLMEKEKLYLQPELSLSDIAGRLRTNVSLLSGIVNNAFGKNFNDFVNEYRVNEFIERIQLPENKHLTLLGIAFDAGFNSKATFNRAFKKFTGKSPKEFLEPSTAS
jgi:AraC-like DNA-binding protein